MDEAKIIKGAVAIVIGLVLLPVVGYFITTAKFRQNSTGVWLEDTAVSNISGLGAVVDLVAYGFAFGLVGLGVGMIAWGFKS